jgi:hypothetical protein
VLGLLVGGCSVLPATRSGSSSTLRPKAVSAEQSATPSSVPPEVEGAMLSAARRVLPEYFSQRVLESDRVDRGKGVDARTLTVRLPDVDPNVRARPKHFDPGKPVFSQLSTPPPPWEQESWGFRS